VNGDWRSEYPFESHFSGPPGKRLHYLDEGSAAHGEPTAAETILCVHGNPTWSFYWRHLVRAWRDRYRVVAIDHLGCGLSDKPQDYPYRLADHVENLRRLIVELDLRNVTLVAHDWGGAIGVGAVLAETERFSRLVLTNTAAFRSNRCPLRIRVCRIPVLGPFAVRRFNLFLRTALSMATAKPERFTPTVRAGYLAPYDNYVNRIAIDRFVGDIPLSPSHPSYETLHKIETGLPRLSEMPILLAWGMRDWCFTPAFLERFREFWPQAEVRRYDDVGHFTAEDAHERLIADVDGFLARHPAAAVGSTPP
jgi:cis-3-alkyl-4-acyloxetan-2-one decarboxylase